MLKAALAAAGEPGSDTLKRIHQRHFEDGMREVLAGKKVMKQSLLDVPAPIVPALEAALPFYRHAPTFLVHLSANDHHQRDRPCHIDRRLGVCVGAVTVVFSFCFFRPQRYSPHDLTGGVFR